MVDVGVGARTETEAWFLIELIGKNLQRILHARFRGSGSDELAMEIRPPNLNRRVSAIFNLWGWLSQYQRGRRRDLALSHECLKN